jgi:hypothetical protein
LAQARVDKMVAPAPAGGENRPIGPQFDGNIQISARHIKRVESLGEDGPRHNRPVILTMAFTPNRTGLGLGVEPNVAGLAISADGKTIVAANNYNDSISVD